VPDGNLFIFDRTSEGRVLLLEGTSPILADELANFKELLECYGLVSPFFGESDAWGLLAAGALIADGFVLASRRDLPALLGNDFFVRSGVAFQIMSLHANNKFCGRCGAPMRDHETERARICPDCGRIVFPALSPAMIVGVEKDGMLLMGHNANFPPDRYSVLAGFVEPGETIEQAVAREVYEESSVRIKNIRYFGSQPWPFPSSMMLGFRADWESGEPSPDGNEITDVRWFTPDDLPPSLPPRVSISRKLIDDWLHRCRGNQTAF
jgi:NAD+ diphosphatase